MATAEQLLQQAREYHQKGQVQTALELYRSAVKANPRNAEAHSALGSALSQFGFDAEAIEHLQRATKLEPTSAMALCALGAAHRSQGRLPQALDCFEKAGWMHKRFPQAVAGATEIYMLRGDYGKAYATLLPYIQTQQDTPPITLCYSWACRFLGKAGEAGPAIARQLSGAGGQVHPVHRIGLLLELALAAESLGHADKAFAAATDANRAYGRRFQAREYVQAVETVIREWTPDVHASLPRAAAESELPVLIVGLPRSGQALVEQILASHSAIGPSGETTLSRQLVQRLQGAPTPHLRAFTDHRALTSQAVNELGGYYASMLNRLSHAEGRESPSRVIDRCTHNYLYLGLFDRIVPGARVIHVTRNPLDTMLSCYMTNFDIPYHFNAHPADFAVAFKAHGRIMDHWRSVVSMPILDVNFEDIVADLEGQSARMLEFLGVPWDPACLEFWKTPRRMVHFRNQGILKPIYTTSVGRHKAYEPFLAQVRGMLGLPPAEGFVAPPESAQERSPG